MPWILGLHGLYLNYIISIPITCMYVCMYVYMHVCTKRNGSSNAGTWSGQLLLQIADLVCS